MLDEVAAEIVFRAGNQSCQADGQSSFQRVQRKRGDPESLSTGTHNVGSANVAAACLANVFTAKDAHQQISKGNRTQHVSDSGDDEVNGHELLYVFLGVTVSHRYCIAPQGGAGL